MLACCSVPSNSARSSVSTADAAIMEYSIAPLVQAEWKPLPWVRSLMGFRAERFSFDVRNRGGTEGPEGRDVDWIGLPNASFVIAAFTPGAPLESSLPALRDTELFLNYGRGFHSNDAHDVVANPREPTLPGASGYEVGIRTQLAEGVELAVSYWWLNLERELVFVGDAGGTEVSPASKRRGIEAVARWSILSWLELDASAAYSRARFVNGGIVAQAPRFVLGSSLTGHHEPTGLAAQLSVRSLGERYGLEDDYGTRLHGYTVVDLGGSWTHENLQLSLVLANLFDTDWESSEFFYESRLPGEAAGVNDFHFTPGIPRSLSARVKYSF
ncbi:MAG: TonB-dependent receptor [Myxococcota bacterium]